MAATLLAATALSSSRALSQSPADQPSSDVSPLESVIVSAQKRSVVQDVQTVPIAVTAVSGVELEQRHVRDLADLTIASPNVTFTDAGTVPGFANFTIRGLGINSTIPSVEPAVGVFIDGVYLGMSAGVVYDLFDIEDVEILRGPQGVLFGRNTTGGAVLINTRRPGDQFAINGRFNYETGPQTTGAVSIEGPLDNHFRAKIAAYYSNDDGWFSNDFDGRSYGASRTGYVRPTIVWTPSMAFDSTLIYERGSRRGDGTPNQNPAYNKDFHLNFDFRGYDRLDWEAVTLESNWRPPFSGAFTNVFGYRRLDQGAAADIDAQPTPRFHAFNMLEQHQFSDELRYFGRLFDRLDLTAGVYYFTQSYFYLERRALVGGAIDSTMGADVDHTNFAAFGQLDYHLDPALTLIAGARFNSEKKTAHIATFVPSTKGSLCNFITQTCVYNFPGPSFPGAPGSDNWDQFTPKLGFQWQTDDSLLFYGHWTRGVRSGGYNVRNTSFSIAPGPYDPERHDAFEVGAKSAWFDRRLLANAALFYDKIKDMQRDVNFPDPVVGVVQTTRNTADATIKGFELELAGEVTDGLLVFANTGYTDGRYDAVFFDLDGGGIGASDLDLAIPRLSRWSYSVGSAYSATLPGDFMVRLRADYGYRSRAAYTDSNATFLQPLESLSASAALTFPGQHWSVSLYGRNLLNKVTEGVNVPLPASLGGGSFRTLNEGRVVGVEMTFTY